ncbi:MAG: hypothetical protein GY930_15155 [bacterium]|nr:hypothetical protein [bacterium]
MATGTPGNRGCGNSLYEHRDLGFEETIVEIRKDETTILGMGLKQGALLKTTVLSTDPVTVPATRSDVIYFGFSPGPPTEPYAILHLEHNTRRSEWVPHYAKKGHQFRSPTCYWPLNETITSERLPYGDYTLVVTRCDGKIERRPVKLESGKTTEITVQF